jgi:glucosamine--fructose-6-phosphate aminotransferase (isomerizing)
MSVETIPLEISETPAAIRATLQETHPASRRAAEAMQARQPRRIYIIGNGTSLYSSMAASYTARLLANAEDPLVIAFPAGDFRYFTPALSAQDVVVGVSASGEFRDVLSIFERLEGKCLRIGITHVADSSIARLADVCLVSAGGASHAAVMTKTYASTLTAAHLLLLDFFSAPAEYYAALAATADLCQATISAAEERIPQVVEQLAGFEHAFHFGAGIGYATALETALKMKEMALLHAEGSETWEMASGPATMVSPRVFCVAHTSGGMGDPATLSGAKKAAEWGARVVEFGPESHVDDLYFPVTPPGVESFASLVLVPPAALLAYRLARRRGYNPNQPAWRERYISQGMTHIIGS